MLMHDLNPQQKEAITYTEGPLLVFAGAGSGKTKIVTYKFTYLIKSKKTPPDSLLTFTFTNKAANDMKKQITQLISKNLNSPWIGTFHSICTKILRKEIPALGYDSDFTIYDEDDQYNLIRHILKEFKMYEALYKGIASRISFLKSSLIGPERFLKRGEGFGFDEKLAKVYLRYQDELRRCNALDFDDLIMLTITLFEREKKILEKYQRQFSYIIVDEFQDTNYAQYHLLKLLSYAHKKICVVGDDDQSIFKFKGANLNNIFNFKNDFPEAKLIKFEQNYRSTKNILEVSKNIIYRNIKRHSKKLWTTKGRGEKVYYCWLNTYEDEAKYIVRVIKTLYLKGTYNYKDFAIFYRVNLQSRVIEDALRLDGLPYRVLGGTSFYQKKEIKDLLSYMRLVYNHGDNVSLRRILNIPDRGIGPSILSKIELEAKKRSIPLYDTIKILIRNNFFNDEQKANMVEFIKLIEWLFNSRFKDASEMLKAIFEKTHYDEQIEDEKIKNILELISSAENISTKEFLDKVSLFTNMDEEISGDYVYLMTLHNTKGLEFPVVFITGLEEGLLPYCKAIKNDEDIAEERRLLYVGMTRAKDLLWLTGANKRKLYSKMQNQEPSRFLKDIPKDCCHWIEKITDKHQIKLTSIDAKDKLDKHFTLFTTGCRVKHPSWGIGVVRDCYGEGEDLKVVINFQNYGIKRIAVKFANLEKI